MNRQAKNNLFVVGIFSLVLILSMVFVLGAHEISITHSNAGSFYVKSSATVANVFTFTINNTDTADGANITQVNVTIPANFSFTYNSNYTNLTFEVAELDFSNTTTVLSWKSWNSSATGILNTSYTGNFSFNATTSKPGNYSLIITTVRTNGTASSTTLNVVVNDTTAPILYFQGNSDNASLANGTDQSNIYLNVSISEDYILRNITFTLWNLTTLINQTTYSLSNNYTNNTINWTSLFKYQVNSTYKYMVNVTNEANLTSNTGMYNITLNDTRAPSVAQVAPSGYNNYSGKIELIGTVADGWVLLDSVFFNVTNASAGHVAFLEAGNTSDTRWNATLDTTNLTDGYYNVTIWANDTTGNKNATAAQNTALRRIFLVDNSGPAVTLTAGTATTSSLTINVAAADALSGVEGACVVDRTGAVVSGTGGTQTITETGLDCGHSYTYTVTCYNYAGVGASSVATSFSTSGCDGGGGGGSSGGGGGGGTTWSKDYKVTAEQFTEGYSQELGTANRMKVKIGGEDHHVGVAKLTEITATIEIASEGSVQVELDVGEDAKMDITEDGYYDVYVRLDGISNSKADVFIQSIHELVPEGADGVVSTTGEVVPEGEEVEIGESSSHAWIWIIVILVVLIAIGAGVGLKKRK